MQLRNIVKAAGMTAHVDFHEQATLDGGDDGRFRPDLTVHLPTDRDIVVDAKVPLEAYLAALEAPDDDRREAELDRHARQLRAHLDALAAKAYHRRLARSAEFVVCFLPNEACYVAALDRDPGLLQHGADRRVLVATPTTLLALLHATHYGWRQAAVERTAEEVVAAAAELHKRAGTFAEHFARLGRQLDSATTAYNQAVGSFEGRVLPQLRRIEQLDGMALGERVPEPAAIDTAPRPDARAGARCARSPTERRFVGGSSPGEDGAMRVLVPIVAIVLFLLVGILPPAAEGAFPGANGRLVWKSHTDTGPQVRTGRLDGRGHRKVGELENFVTGAAEQSGWARWSPSGERLVYFDLAGDGIVVKDARGRLIRKVAKGLWDPDWSPGRRGAGHVRLRRRRPGAGAHPARRDRGEAHRPR